MSDHRLVSAALLVGLTAAAGCGPSSSGSRRSAAAPVVTSAAPRSGSLLGAAVPTAPPRPPSGLTARVANVRRIALAWTDRSASEREFAIERRRIGAGATAFARVATVGAGVERHEDVAPAAGAEFAYRVRAVNGAGASPPSNPARVTAGDGLVGAPRAFGSRPPYAVALADLDGDGDLDVAAGHEAVNGADHANRILLNDGAGGLADTGQRLGAVGTRALVLGDLDGDGDVDLVAGNNGGADAVWLNDGQAGFRPGAQALAPRSITRALALGDLDGDGDLDLVAGYHFRPDAVWLNDGAGAFTAGPTLRADDTDGLGLADLDGDGDLDVVAAGERAAEVWWNDGAGGLRAGPVANAPATVRCLALGDVDGDGAADLALGLLRRRARLLRGGPGGTFTDTGQALGSDRITWSLALADMDGDGDLDLTLGTGDAGQQATPRLLRNDGSGSLGPGAATLPPTYTRDHALGDMDGDGDLDLVGADIVAGAGAVRVYPTR